MEMNQLRICCFVALIVGGVPVAAAPQSTAAAVFGTVADEQQAVLPNVTITLRRLETGESRTVTSDAGGSFRVIGLAPGGYELRAVLPPFAELVLSNIVLGLNDEAGLPLTLRLGRRIVAAHEHVMLAVAPAGLDHEVGIHRIQSLHDLGIRKRTLDPLAECRTSPPVPRRARTTPLGQALQITPKSGHKIRSPAQITTAPAMSSQTPAAIISRNGTRPDP